MRNLAWGLLFPILSALPQPALAQSRQSIKRALMCITSPAREQVAAVVADARTVCSCCVVPNAGPRRRCIRRLTKRAVRANGLPRACARFAVQGAALPCPLGVASTPCPPRERECSIDAECDDGNPCTRDQCQYGFCGHECECLSSRGETECCPEPADGCPVLRYFRTCGDPVCGGDRAHPGVPPCESERAGVPCALPGRTCNPGYGCDVLLACTTEEPDYCPISRRRYKDDIRYLADADRRRLHDDLLRLKLARYRYVGEEGSAPAHLGFVIDDVGPSPAVGPDGDHVDVYGYASMAVAALQVQAREIARLRAELEELRGQVEAGRTKAAVVQGSGPRR